VELFLIIWAAFGVVTALAANSRGRSPVAWFFIGLIGGIFGLIAVLVMKDESGT
jgi:hypothetical protein